MGIFDKLKDVTGVGLNASQQYNRAYEKGVFLQPPNYEDAAKHFLSAEEKFQKEGNSLMSDRAHANHLLYALVHAKSSNNLDELLGTLEKVSEIERFGSQTEMVSTEKMIAEFRALKNELTAEQSNGFSEKISNFKKASEIIIKLGNEALFFMEKLSIKGPIHSAIIRSLYYTAKSDYFNAFSILTQSPEQAHNFFQKAAIGFKQAQTSDLANETEAIVESIKAKRHCWICDREMQGRDFFYKHYPAITQKYHKDMIEKAKQDIGMLEKDNAITLCTVCGSTVENQADIYATKRVNELKDWVEPIIQSHQSAIASLEARLAEMAKFAHSHH